MNREDSHAQSGSSDAEWRMVRAELNARENEREGKAGGNTNKLSSRKASSTESNGRSGERSLAPASGRSRKGSLRKAAMAKMREQIIVTPPSNIIPLSLGDTSPQPSLQLGMHPHGKNFLSPPSGRASHAQHKSEQLESPSTSSLEGPSGSTSDEDDAVSMQFPSTGKTASAFEHQETDSVMQRRSHHSKPRATPTATPTPTDPDIDDDWDYSETEWWGWVILTATWIVFVVVIGSCFGVWTWAWDVGETPYAPPDLEDDDTLPITGYYPALIVCTAVMSWVWVVVAWVGLKYFRHSKVVADDG